MNRSRPIYLDYQATTPLDPEVRAAMLPFLEDRFGNPHSEHALGWDAAEAVDEGSGSRSCFDWGRAWRDHPYSGSNGGQ